ncbi:hypothetical protein CO046_00910 [Candidatus Peregrinibacteria bacterium CG_4_9_14_0_2_um_filter_53_11]|nr:MAG: hypothetical protein CO046_00910 [Candidatus Peregrinibacteria bacterium CG_4_9_14_0_2_um_filter_53_11]
MSFRDIIPPEENESRPRKKKGETISVPNHTLHPKRSSVRVVSGEGEKQNGRSARKQKTLLVSDRTSAFQRKIVREITIILLVGVVVLFGINLLHLKSQGMALQNNVTDTAKAGVQLLVQATLELEEKNFLHAQELFTAAQGAFDSVDQQTWFTRPSRLFNPLQDPHLATARALTTVGVELSRAGRLFSEVLAATETLPQDIFRGNREGVTKQPSLTEQLKAQLPTLHQATSSVKTAAKALTNLPERVIPADVRETVALAQRALDGVSTLVGRLESEIPTILILLGDEAPHTYLVLIQNNAELRPTGGFIGNVAIMEMNDGHLTRNEVHDIYSYDHQLVEKITPPDEIAIINDRWFMRDSNFSADFPTSARTTADFLEKEGGPGVDTIIAIDQQVIANILNLTGPVEVEGLSKPLSAENFSNVLSYVIESKLFGREQPKIILANFMESFQERFFEGVDPASLLPLLKASITGKHLLIYSTDEAVQKFAIAIGADGALPQLKPKEDFLAIAHTSVAGNKSDSYIRETIAHDTYLNRDGSVSNELTITRQHTWNSRAEAQLRTLLSSFGYEEIPLNILQILGKSHNIEMLRIYVPTGTVLEENHDPNLVLKHDSETNLDYFSTRLSVAPGDTNALRIRYRLPFTLDFDPVDEYRLRITKQAGQSNIQLIKRVFPDGGMHNYKAFPEAGRFDLDQVWKYTAPLTSDLMVSTIWGS